MKDAVASLHVNSKSDPENAAQSVAMISQLKSQIDQQLDDNLGSNESVKTTVKDVVAEVMSVVEDTLKKGNLNGGAVVLGDGPFTLVAGGTGQRRRASGRRASRNWPTWPRRTRTSRPMA